MTMTQPRTPLPVTPFVTCPACSTGHLVVPVDGGPARCDSCGHSAGAGLVTEAAWLLGEQSKLLNRLTWVKERIAAGDLTTATPFAPPSGSGASGVGTAGPGGPGRPAAERHERRPVPLQTALLGIGALLLVIAAVVFAAVAWDRLGAIGQLSMLAIVVGSLSAAAHGLRRRFRATAETLAAVAAAVAAVGFVAAPRLGLGTEWMKQDNALWLTIALLAVAVLALGLGALSRLVAWRVAVIVGLVGAACSATIALAGEDVGTPAPLGIAGIAAIAAVVLGLSPRGGRGHLDADARLPQSRPIGISLGIASVALALTGYDNSLHVHAWTLTWAVIAAAAFVLASRIPSVVTALVAGLAAAQVPVFAVAGFDPGWQRIDDAVLAPALLGLAVLGGIALFAAYLVDADRRITGVALRPTLLALGGGIWLVAMPMLDDHGWIWPFWASRYLAVIAGSLLVVALWHRLLPAAWASGAVACAAFAVFASDLGWEHRPESFTLPMAGLLLVAGLVATYRARGSRDTLVTYGPALGMALVPSAFTAVDDAVAGNGALRAVIVLAVAAVLVVAGMLARLRGPLAVGLVALVVAGAGQLWALADLVPRWVVLALAGALLVAAGFSLEALGRAGRHAWEKTKSLR